MIAASTERRNGELSRAVLIQLSDAPDGLAIQDVVDRLAASGPPMAEETIRSSTIELVKAGWLTKSGGTWRVTDKGRAAVSRFPDPVEFYRAAVRRRDPTVVARSTSPSSDTGDIFAGCFLSLAGSLVGAVIGTIVLFVRMLPDPSLAVLGGFAAAFVVGVVVGFLASFPIAGLAVWVGRGPSLTENLWLGGTAVIAGISAAVTPSLLISVDAAG